MNNHRAPKLEDVAKLAGVSKATVSHVLNRRGYLSQKTITKVENAVRQLNYHPNTVARQLYKQKTNIIGMIFPSVDNPFFCQLEAEIEHYLDKEGYRVLMCNSMNDPEKEERYLKNLLTHQIDGLIIGSHNQHLQGYQHRELPIVAIDKNINENVPVVSSDNYQGGMLATRRLIADGCRHILHTNGPLDFDSPTQERRRAFEQVMAENNLPAITYHLSFTATFEDKVTVFNQLFTEHPEVDGIFASNDMDASLLISLAKKFGKQVPEDLKIIGYDGANATRFLRPELTTIKQPIDQIAKVAVQLLLARIDHCPVQSVVLPVSIVNGTTA
ncbi:LacI family DNA-binding transcriptional regulator [Limosilactobacillus mucosae]|uniref:LacI family DNA-binding transcriptional regulator n=1 Tax=Limosilactobacillus mucosae TaxID=97478 RepID=UPI00233E7FEB|nr:LacI family DNA-binding transcriptional regulator [Limosilactobacillus mucosae]MDC2840143.1 LacI family DNA-binding transcriptional regulator [Limosilactobacillus mucosae]